jgi:hypothetical protein
MGNLKYVNLYYIQDLFPLATFERYEIIPACKFISYKPPIGAENKIEEKDKRSYKVDKSYYPKPIIEIGFGPFHEG